MREALYETFHKTSPLGISFAWFTSSGGHHPLHWHDEVEILYPLSGKADIVIDGVQHDLLKRHLLVVESGQIHSTHSNSNSAMFLCIHISKSQLKEYLPQIENLRIHCIPSDVPDSKFQQYLDLCRMLDDLTRLYMKDSPSFYMEADGVILQLCARLFENFSVSILPSSSSLSVTSADRIRKVIDYVEAHFQEQFSLNDAASILSFSREYFCRFFKKNMGISFLQYVNETRISHIYYDLTHTDLPISEIMENNGFTNQKLFNRMFKQLYNGTPSEIRKQQKNEGHFVKSSLFSQVSELLPSEEKSIST